MHDSSYLIACACLAFGLTFTVLICEAPREQRRTHAHNIEQTTTNSRFPCSLTAELVVHGIAAVAFTLVGVWQLVGAAL